MASSYEKSPIIAVRSKEDRWPANLVTIQRPIRDGLVEYMGMVFKVMGMFQGPLFIDVSSPLQME